MRFAEESTLGAMLDLEVCSLGESQKLNLTVLGECDD